jgi:peptide deformylase
MILPIYVYGQSVLRKVADEIDQKHEGLSTFIRNLWDTMYKCDGLGLAAPQVGKSIRLFVIDGAALAEDDASMTDFKQAFLNAKIIEREGEEWAFTEGCLSLPTLREEVYRPSKIRIQYYDENWQFHDEYFDGLKARIIQHEYDHIEGLLFVDHIPAIRRQLIKGKLTAISKGKVNVSYKIKTAK